MMASHHYVITYILLLDVLTTVMAAVILHVSPTHRVYSHQNHFQRLLRLLSNDIMQKAKSIIGNSVLEEPEESLPSLKLALRVCAAFRGCYLDFREQAMAFTKKLKEERESHAICGEESTSGSDQNSFRFSTDGRGGETGRGRPAITHTEPALCSWPPRNSAVFTPINGMMERCNDLLELVQTLQDFQYVRSN